MMLYLVDECLAGEPRRQAALASKYARQTHLGFIVGTVNRATRTGTLESAFHHPLTPCKPHQSKPSEFFA